MKIFRKAGILAIATFMMFSFSSCGDDDGDDNGGGSKGNGKVEVNGHSATLGHAYYWYQEESGEMMIDFYNYDLNSSKWPKSISYLGIYYKVPKGTLKPTTTTVESVDYHCYVAIDVPINEEGGYHAETGYMDTTNDPLSIKIEGNKLTLNLNCRVGDETTLYPMTFSYEGKIQEIPDRYKE